MSLRQPGFVKLGAWSNFNNWIRQVIAEYVADAVKEGHVKVSDFRAPSCRVCYSNTRMFFFLQIALSSLGHTVTLTFPGALSGAATSRCAIGRCRLRC